MRGNLRDLVEHTYDLGCIDAVKITGSDSGTEIAGLSDDRTVVLKGEFKAPVDGFGGVFGMPNLAKLKVLLGIPEYKDGANITVQYKGDQPVGLRFSNKSGDFQNDYRFMTPEVVAEKLKTVKFRGADWNIEIEPSVASIQRFKFQSQANAEETTFKVCVEDGDLVFHFGDHSTHAGKFVFQANVKGNLATNWSWPIARVQAIMDLNGEKVMRISDSGVCEVTVDSGIAVYTYMLPAMSK